MRINTRWMIFRNSLFTIAIASRALHITNRLSNPIEKLFKLPPWSDRNPLKMRKREWKGGREGRETAERRGRGKGGGGNVFLGPEGVLVLSCCFITRLKLYLDMQFPQRRRRDPLRQLHERSNVSGRRLSYYFLLNIICIHSWLLLHLRKILHWADLLRDDHPIAERLANCIYISSWSELAELVRGFMIKSKPLVIFNRTGIKINFSSAMPDASRFMRFGAPRCKVVSWPDIDCR